MEDFKDKNLVLFLVFEEIKPKEGISKKILAQVKAFESNGIKCLLGRFEYDSKEGVVYKIGKEEIQLYENNILGKINKRYNFSGIKNYINLNSDHIKFIYIRYTKFANFGFISLFREISKNVPIILEIPTYPYDGESRVHLIRKYRVWEEKLCRKQLAKFVNKIVTYSSDESIFGCATIKINNAIDFTNIQIRKPSKKDNTFDMIGVADLSFWHGYDRIIEGIKEYIRDKNNQSIKFHIVGGYSGKEEYERLKELVAQYSLELYVKFYGTLSGDELNSLFNIADIAIGCLGCHRKGIAEVQSLKNVEYAARGIPFIYSEKNINFDSANYVLKVSPDDTPIDIEKLIEFTKFKIFSPEEIRQTVLDFTWDSQMDKVLTSYKK